MYSSRQILSKKAWVLDSKIRGIGKKSMWDHFKRPSWNEMLFNMALNTRYLKIFWLKIFLQNLVRYRCFEFHFFSPLVPSSFEQWLRTVAVNKIIGYAWWKFQYNRRSCLWNIAFWIWLDGVNCSLQRPLSTHWTCVLARFHKKSFSRPEEATFKLLDGIKMFPILTGTIS